MPTAYITAPQDTAADLARDLVEAELAACVNLVDCDSVYRWEGEVVTDEETILLAKTTEERYADLQDFVEEHHPYDVPCVERFDETVVSVPFAEWIAESVRE